MTLQKADILKYNENDIHFWGDILYEYFEKYPDRLVKTPGIMTSLRRGYFAEFEITKEGELIIVSLKRYIGFDKKKGVFIPESFLDKAFPNTKKCDFFSGFIRVDNNYSDSENTEFIVLEFDNGNLIKEHILKYTEFQILKERKKVK